jgi:hypothetical protein
MIRRVAEGVHFRRNRCSLSIGIGVQIAPESVFIFARIFHMSGPAGGREVVGCYFASDIGAVQRTPIQDPVVAVADCGLSPAVIS